MGKPDLLIRRPFPPVAVRGFTLIEMMVVVSVLAVLASLAAPSFKTFIISQRVKTASFDLYSGLLYARSEAIKRGGGTVRLTPTDSANWASGWAVAFTDTDGTVSTLRDQGGVKGVVITTDPAAKTYIEFRQDGRPNLALKFPLVASETSSGVTGRCVNVTASGAVSTKTGGC